VENDTGEIPEQSTSEKFGRSDENSLRKSVADKLKQGFETIAKEFKRQQTDFSHHEQEDIEKRIAFDFAIQHNLWIDDLYTLGKPTHAGGYENTLALNDVTGFLFKSNNLFNAKFLISNLLEQIGLHNELFPETYYELVGFTGFDNGIERAPYIEVILKQIYVDNVIQASEQEILNFMTVLGFEKMGDAVFMNEKYVVADLYPRNVLKDEHGFIYVVDDIVTRRK